MVRNDDCIDTGIRREDGVLVRQNALDDDFHLGRVAQPLEEIPGHRGGLRVRQSRDVEALIHRTALEIRREAAALVARIAVARVGRDQTKQRFLIAPAGTIDRHGDRKATGLLDPLHHRSGDLPAVRGVELIPDRLPARRRDILNAGIRCGRENLQMIAGARGFRHADLSV